jgi:segregation and condensation protein B
METWELKAGVEGLLIGVNRPVTLKALALALDSDEPAIEDALRELESDLAAADRGAQIRRRANGIRLEVKPQFADRIARAIPEWAPKPITSQALETLAIIAMKQPVTVGDINAIRGIESAGTLQTLRNRKLVARTAQLGPRREKYWRTTPLFLETFGLNSLEDLYQEGGLENAFPSLYSGVIDEDDEVEQPEDSQAQPVPATSE